jgi:hypothetical protein
MPCNHFSLLLQGCKLLLQILHIVFQELVREFEISLSSIHPVITIPVSVACLWASMGMKYAVKEIQRHKEKYSKTDNRGMIDERWGEKNFRLVMKG